MALCVEVIGNALQVVGDYSASCTGYALMSANEYATTPTLAAIFSTPDPDVIQAAFMTGFGLPVILWLTSWGFGVVVNWFDRSTDASQTLDDN